MKYTSEISRYLPNVSWKCDAYQEELQNCGFSVWVWRDLYRATHAVIRGLIFGITSEGTPTFNCLLRQAWGPGELKVLYNPNASLLFVSESYFFFGDLNYQTNKNTCTCST